MRLTGPTYTHCGEAYLFSHVPKQLTEEERNADGVGGVRGREAWLSVPDRSAVSEQLAVFIVMCAHGYT